MIDEEICLLLDSTNDATASQFKLTCCTPSTAATSLLEASSLAEEALGSADTQATNSDKHCAADDNPNTMITEAVSSLPAKSSSYTNCTVSNPSAVSPVHCGSNSEQLTESKFKIPMSISNDVTTKSAQNSAVGNQDGSINCKLTAETDNKKPRRISVVTIQRFDETH